MHEWMLDNGFTPHLVVDAKREGVRVPEAHVKDGKIVLNVSPTATHALRLGNDAVTFEARFGGVSRQLVVPVAAVLWRVLGWRVLPSAGRRRRYGDRRRT